MADHSYCYHDLMKEAVKLVDFCAGPQQTGTRLAAAEIYMLMLDDFEQEVRKHLWNGFTFNAANCEVRDPEGCTGERYGFDGSFFETIAYHVRMHLSMERLDCIADYTPDVIRLQERAMAIIGKYVGVPFYTIEDIKEEALVI